MSEAWDRHATWWQAAFTAGADPEYTEQILPLVAARLSGAERLVEIGTGEGQVARAAGARRAVGVDPSWEQVREARSRGGGPSYARALAEALPFPEATFDAAVACLVLEHVEDLDSALGEAARVLRPGGRFLLLLNHPLLQTPGSGWVDDRILDEQYWRVGPYLTETSTAEEVERGVTVTFYHRPLSRYVNTLAAFGMTVCEMDEPPPPPGFLALAPVYADAATIPRLLVLEARKGARPQAGPGAPPGLARKPGGTDVVG